MIASQADPGITNEGSLVIPLVTGRLVAQFPEEERETVFGLLSIHNELGSNKSVMLPMYREPDISTLTIATSPPIDEVGAPSWFVEACQEVSPQNPRAVKASLAKFAKMAAEGSGEMRISRDIQLNALIPSDSSFLKAQPINAVKMISYEVLSGHLGSDVANYRRVVPAGDYLQNGHMVEAILNSSIMPAWGCDELDLPYSLCRDLRWLGAQYLNKNTRGNLFPQLCPMIEEMIRQEEIKQMAGMNESWGALSALTAMIRR